MDCHIYSFLLPAQSNNYFTFDLGNDLQPIGGLSMFNCAISSILTNSVFSYIKLCIFVLLQICFYFLIFEKHNSKIGELSSRKLHSGTFRCPRMDLAGTPVAVLHRG